MSVSTPDSAAQVEDRIKADVAREAPDSNPYLTVHWLRSLIAGLARRIFDFYRDLNRTEKRLFPDTADEETAPVWGNIYIGPPNAATPAKGFAVAGGVGGGSVSIGETLTAGGVEYDVLTGGVVAVKNLTVASITRSGTIATVTTDDDHDLASFIPVTIAGAAEPEYNVIDTAITVTAANQFQYNIVGTPASPATGTITSTSTNVLVEVQSTTFGSTTNLDADTELLVQSPIANVNDQFYVTFGTLGGGTGEEATADYKDRYLEKIRTPLAHFNEGDVTVEAKKVSGVTRVFVERSGTEIGPIAVTSIERSNDIAKVITATPHNFEDGNRTSIAGAAEPEYNVSDTPIIVADATTFYYIVNGTPSTPATGTVTAQALIALGQSRTYFMRDNDTPTIPSASEVQAVKDQIDTILPINTSLANNIVAAPTAVSTDYVFTALVPNTPTMQTAIDKNLDQFYAEQVNVSQTIEEDAYRAAIQNTVDPANGDTVSSFALSAPSGDILITSGQIGIKGTITPAP